MFNTINNLEQCFIDDKEVSGTASLKHEQGQVLVLDFWYNECGSCQKPMAHNQEMLEKYGSQWGNRVRIIGMSIDSAEIVKSYCKEKKWTKVEHYACSTLKAASSYGVTGYPTIVIVDTQGKIVFKDHFPQFEVEEAINKLLKGETLKYP